MIKCWVGLGGGGELALPTAVSWKFCYGTDTPCDSFFVRCLWKRGQERMLSAACRFFAQWEEERVFTGVVDEFAVICGTVFVNHNHKGQDPHRDEHDVTPHSH